MLLHTAAQATAFCSSCADGSLLVRCFAGCKTRRHLRQPDAANGMVRSTDHGRSPGHRGLAPHLPLHDALGTPGWQVCRAAELDRGTGDMPRRRGSNPHSPGTHGQPGFGSAPCVPAPVVHRVACKAAQVPVHAAGDGVGLTQALLQRAGVLLWTRALPPRPVEGMESLSRVRTCLTGR